MIKIYLDWNVLSQMKNHSHASLLEIIMQKDKFLNFYSTAHISDIVSSHTGDTEQDDVIKSDLNFISEITDDYCLYHENKNIVVEQRMPEELFQGQIESKDIFQNISIDKLFGSLSDVDPEIQSLVKPYLDILKNLPIDPIFKESFEDPQKREHMKEFLPGLEDNMTMEGLLNAILKMFENLNESDGYVDLRSTIQKGLQINRDRIFDTAEPYKMIQSAYKKIGPEFIQPDIKKNGPKWFDDILDEYLALDMHGYQEDRVSVDSKRKETFKNTTNDAFHVAFGSMADFYITNDKKSLKKCKAVYDKIGINTRIFKPSEFVQYYNEQMLIKELGSHFHLFFEVLKSKEYQEIVEDKRLSKIYMLPFFLFDYFNKVYVELEENNPPTILLSKEKPTNNRFTFGVELKNLIAKFNILLGEDFDKIGEFENTELTDSSWKGRRWDTPSAGYRLTMINGYCQFYLDIKTKDEK
jgi:hypothetical protein